MDLIETDGLRSQNQQIVTLWGKAKQARMFERAGSPARSNILTSGELSLPNRHSPDRFAGAGKHGCVLHSQFS